MLEQQARSGAVRSASQMQVRAPIHDRSIGRWRAYAGVLAPVLPRLQAIADADDEESGRRLAPA